MFALKLLPSQMLLQADEAQVADNNVVDQFDIENAARHNELFRAFDVLWTRGGIPAGVEMCMFMLGMFVAA